MRSQNGLAVVLSACAVESQVDGKERKEPLFNQCCSAYIFYGFSS